MSRCCVTGCRNSQRKIQKVPAFAFPQNVNMRQKWLKEIKIDPETIMENTRVCLLHFSEDDIFRFPTYTKLKPGRIPHVNLPPASDEDDSETELLLEEIQDSSCEKDERNVEPNSQETEPAKLTYLPATHVCKMKSPFLIENFKYRDKKIFFYTGIPQYEILVILFKHVWESESGSSPGTSHHSAAKRHSSRKCHELTPMNELFLTLMKLWKGFDHEMLADMFGISDSAVSRIFLAWTNLLYVKLTNYNIFPHRNVLMNKAPRGFLEKNPKVIGSINCIEINIEAPSSSLITQSQYSSHYAGTNTLKSLVMINNTGGIIFVSALYSGAISDKKILENSGFLDFLRKKVEIGDLQPEDIILANKRFEVKKIIEDQEDLSIDNIPTFRITGMKFQPDKIENMKKLSHGRTYVERAINRLQSFEILNDNIPSSLLGNVNQIYTVVALLTNFRYPYN